MNPGNIIGGRYRIIRSLGEGGMANVYLAHDTVLDRDVSVKLLRLDLRDDPSTMRRFHREALSATQLNDPHIVGVYDVGEDNGLQYMVMQYVQGTDLKDYIKQNYPIPLPQVVDIMKQILSAVEAAHAHGIIHRDLKPQNILIDENKNIKITDFGIAVATSQNSLTQTNTLMGSVHYLSPEQARGSVATKQSDIYSLGIILFELLTGSVPFEGETAVAIALKHFREDMPSVRTVNAHIPQALENVVLRSTAKIPAERYGSVREMAVDLSTSLNSDRAEEPRWNSAGDDGKTKVLSAAEISKQLKATEMEDDKEDEPKEESHRSADKKPKKPMDPRLKKGLIGLAIVVVLTIASGLSWWFMFREVVVPDVEGKTAIQAEKVLHKHGLRVGNITRSMNASVAKNHIISTSPEYSTKKRVNGTVDLELSAGVKSMKMGKYVGENGKSIAAYLRGKGFHVETKTVYSDDVAKGKIIKQNKKKGKMVYTDKDTIKLTISAGKEQIKVPNFKDQDITVVQQFANKHHLQLTTQEKESKSVANNHVISQTPTAGQYLTHGDTLTVTLSSTGNNTKTTNIQINIPFDGNGGKTENRVQIYIRDARHNLGMEYQDITINQETTINVPFTLKNGQMGAYRVVRNGRTIMSAVNITA
ncbi:MAG: Stk1 family PASTA domain-containing Ser/Thr kinase [Limosilactobacillus sp.]|uniref:Stk1 family PASTA domain-containing Ser/Thr kinase n=1 Tax=Limosilactobacillus sp. TaxID=2773925 RepID=UPI002703F53E|nr:Stk1 family PASTA domain-containing Ser/Thr kinase [Limosilactobacillus sp.]